MAASLKQPTKSEVTELCNKNKSVGVVYVSLYNKTGHKELSYYRTIGQKEANIFLDLMNKNHQIERQESDISKKNSLLKELEFSGIAIGPGSGPMDSGGNGARVRCCPSCGGIDPSDRLKNNFSASYHGHKQNCKLAEILK